MGPGRTRGNSQARVTWHLQGQKCGGCSSAAATSATRALLFLQALLQVHLGVPLLLVRPRELPSADVAGEGLFAGVRPDVGREVVGAAEGAHADSALEGLLPGVYPNVAG